MPLAHVNQVDDPTRSIVLRALRWWWLGLGIALVVGVAYYASSKESNVATAVAKSTLWADNPNALRLSGSMLPETAARMNASVELPDSVTVVFIQDHLDVSIDGTGASAADDYAATVELAERTFGAIATERLAPEIARAQAQVDAAEARSVRIAEMMDGLASGDSEVRQVYLVRLLAAEDAAAFQEGVLADVAAQANGAVVVRATPLAENGESVLASGGGKLDLLIGLFFGGVLGLVAMIGLATFDRRVRSASNLAGSSLGNTPVIECSTATMAADALLVAGATPVAGSDTRVVVLASHGVPAPVIATLSDRHGSVDVVTNSLADLATPPADLPQRLAGANAVVVVQSGGVTQAQVDQLVGMANAYCLEVSALAMVPRSL